MIEEFHYIRIKNKGRIATVAALGIAYAAGAAIVADPDEAAKIAGAVAALEKQGWTWFGLAQEG